MFQIPCCSGVMTGRDQISSLVRLLEGWLRGFASQAAPLTTGPVEDAGSAAKKVVREHATYLQKSGKRKQRALELKDRTKACDDSRLKAKSCAESKDMRYKTSGTPMTPSGNCKRKGCVLLSERISVRHRFAIHCILLLNLHYLDAICCS